MKRLLLIMIVFSFIACNEAKDGKEDLIKENIENKLKERLKDPDSYEFVSMKLSDSISAVERKKTINQDHLKELEELNKNTDVQDMIENSKKEIKLLSNLKDNEIALYRYELTAKATNSFGGKIQSKYIANVLNDKNKTVLSVSKN